VETCRHAQHIRRASLFQAAILSQDKETLAPEFVSQAAEEDGTISFLNGQIHDSFRHIFCHKKKSS